MLDERLALAARLYERCGMAADIGTDHGLLPCHLLKNGICDRMILADVSAKALEHARENVRRFRLEDRARIVCADGLDAVDEQCGCVSIMGMGGGTMAEILRRGKARLQGAVLVLSAHTEQPLVRQAVQDIGYRIVNEELCYAAGRYYIFWRAEEGCEALSPQAIRYGGRLFETPSPLMQGYLRHRITVAETRRRGLLSGAQPRDVREADEDIAFYRERLRELL